MESEEILRRCQEGCEGDEGDEGKLEIEKMGR